MCSGFATFSRYECEGEAVVLEGEVVCEYSLAAWEDCTGIE
jgi:hypothetical protein